MDLDERQCVAFLLLKEREKGVGGILFVRNEEWAYMMPDDVFWTSLPPAFTEQLLANIEVDKGCHFFIVVQSDTALNVVKYSRERALHNVVAWTTPGTCQS